MDTKSLILPVFNLLIQKAPEEKVSDIANNIKKSMEGQALIEFNTKDERSVHVAMSEFKKEFEIPYFTISQDSESVVLAFPGELSSDHIDFFTKRDVAPNQL